MKDLLWCALCAIALSVFLLVIGIASGFPSAGGGAFMFLGLPGYGTAATVTSVIYGPDDINSRRALVWFGFVYVLVNAAFFNSLFIVVWKTVAALGRSSKRRRI